MRSVRSKAANKQQMGLRSRVLCSPAACVRCVCVLSQERSGLVGRKVATDAEHLLGAVRYDGRYDGPVLLYCTAQYSPPSK
jgi:hypothetical protein